MTARPFEFEVQARYSPVYGWECVTTEETPAAAAQRKREYEAAEPNVSFRVKPVPLDP